MTVRDRPTMARQAGAITMLVAIACSVSCRQREPSAREPSARQDETIVATPFAQRSAGPGKTLFHRLSSAETGIDFVHQWSSPEDYPHDLETMMAGGGVAIGDFDGDQRPDVYLARPAGGNRLYRNLGQLRFADVTERAGLHDPEFWGGGASCVDIDNDGDLDIYACGHDCPNRLFINQGDGSFQEKASDYGLDFRGASVMMAFADFDRDGDLDGYLLTNHLPPPPGLALGRAARIDGRWQVPQEVRQYRDILVTPENKPVVIRAAQYDHLLRNDGPDETGQIRFTNVGEEAGISGNHHGLSATWWDYDHDGLPDLYVANDFTDPDRLYRNNGDGTFTDVLAEAVPHTPWFSMGTDVGDINNDGRLDFLATDMAGTSHYKQKVGMGEMASRFWFLDYPVPRQYIRNALYLNTGTPRFMEVAQLAGIANTDWTWAVRMEDFDNDGRLDIFVTNGMTRDWQNSDLKNHVQSLGGKDSPAGRRFWLNQPPKSEANLAFRNLGGLRFAAVEKQWGLDDSGVSFGAATSDLDLDGDLDLVVNHFQQEASVYRNDSTAGNRVAFRLRGSTSNRFGIGATVKIETEVGQQLRYLTLARGFMSSSDPDVHLGVGKADSIQELTIIWPSGRRQTHRNLAANHRYTIVERDDRGHAAESLGRVPMYRASDALVHVRHREAEFDDFQRQPLLPNKLSRLGPGMAWGDVDQDGDDDLFVGGAAGQPGMLTINMDGRFVVSPQSSTAQGVFAADQAAEDMGATFFDVDSDGDLDLYCVSGGVEWDPDDTRLRDRLYLNSHGSFARAPSGVVRESLDSGSIAAAADYDRDGDVDLFVGGRCVPGEYPRPARSRLLRNDSNSKAIRLTDVTRDSSDGFLSGLVTGAIWSDVDNDGWLDLLVTEEWGPVRLFRNQQGQLVERTSEAGLAERHGWWTGISAGDFDNDQDMDYIVTNFGLNTKYHASVEQPHVLYYGDFDEGGRPRIVEAEYEGDALYPMRGKSCSSHAIPALQQRFASFHDFAMASLAEIYTQRCLDDALRLYVNTLQSGMLMNDGKGRFTFQPLPRLAQAAPCFGSAVIDADGDRQLDIFVVQNFFSPQLETGRMDGGVSLLLRGDGSGSFSPVWPAESGLLISDDAKSLTVADANGNGFLDFVVGVNDGSTRVFERAAPDTKCINVRLCGKPGNPTAIGSRVELQLQSGQRLVREIHAANGFLSQSSAVISLAVAPRTVKHIKVRWPDGTESVTPSDELREVTVSQP